MFISNIFTNLHFNEFHIYLLCVVVTFILLLFKILIYKRIDIIGILSFVGITTLAVIFSTEELKSVWNIIITILYYGNKVED